MTLRIPDIYDMWRSFEDRRREAAEIRGGRPISPKAFEEITKFVNQRSEEIREYRDAESGKLAKAYPRNKSIYNRDTWFCGPEFMQASRELHELVEEMNAILVELASEKLRDAPPPDENEERILREHAAYIEANPNWEEKRRQSIAVADAEFWSKVRSGRRDRWWDD